MALLLKILRCYDKNGKIIGKKEYYIKCPTQIAEKNLLFRY